MDSNPLLVSSNPGNTSRKYQHGDLDILKDCDSIGIFSECGYFCVLGFKDRTRRIYIHFNNSDEWYDLLGRNRLAYNGETIVPSENAYKVWQSKQTSHYDRYRMR